MEKSFKLAVCSSLVLHLALAYALWQNSDSIKEIKLPPIQATLVTAATQNSAPSTIQAATPVRQKTTTKTKRAEVSSDMNEVIMEEVLSSKEALPHMPKPTPVVQAPTPSFPTSIEEDVVWKNKLTEEQFTLIKEAQKNIAELNKGIILSIPEIMEVLDTAEWPPIPKGGTLIAYKVDKEGKIVDKGIIIQSTGGANLFMEQLLAETTIGLKFNIPVDMYKDSSYKWVYQVFMVGQTESEKLMP